MADDQLQLLIVDDSQDDADHAVRTLQAAGLGVTIRRVHNSPGLNAALAQRWDLILTEFSLLQCNAQTVIDTIKTKELTTPVIVLTRSINDKNYDAVMVAGAHDVVRKNNIVRLTHSVRRALATVAANKKLHTTEQALHGAKRKIAEMERKTKVLSANAPKAMCYCQDGLHLKASEGYLSLFGYDNETEIETIPILDLIAKADQRAFKRRLKQADRGEIVAEALEITALQKDGNEIHLAAHMSPTTLGGKPCTQVSLEDISQRKITENRLRYLTERDPLTGLFNRIHFSKALKTAWQATQAGAPATMLLYFDLYEIKEVNNKHGYMVGDGVLLKITKLFRERLASNATLARFGDEELVVLLPDTNRSTGEALMREIAEMLKNAGIVVNGKRIECRHAAAAVLVDRGLASAHEAISRAMKQVSAEHPTDAATADHASAKRPPQKATANANATPETPPESADMDALIDTALQKDSIRLLYQPTVCLEGENDEIFEVLLRMVDERWRLIPPRAFMPAAIKSGRIADLDRWVTRRTIETLAALQSTGRDVTYFINISLDHACDSGLAQIIKADIDKWKIQPERFVIELMDDAVGENFTKASKFISAVSALGCGISLDSAGSITTTLPRLPKNTIRFLKFNADAVTSLTSDNEKNMFATVADMAREQDIKTVAARVESAGTLAEIWPYGFDYVQGHYFRQAGSELDFDFLTEEETTLGADDVPPPSWSN